MQGMKKIKQMVVPGVLVLALLLAGCQNSARWANTCTERRQRLSKHAHRGAAHTHPGSRPLCPRRNR